MEDKKIGIVILVITIVLIGLVFYINVSDSLDFLADPLMGEGLGVLCSSADECRDFCHTNKGRCSKYCNENPANKLCSTMFRGSG